MLGPCRLPYTLLEENKQIDRGYLLSPRDLCSLEDLPKLILAGVKSFKIEGRMKSPIYVATVTKIYRKYIDLANKFINHEIEEYNVEEIDKKELMQVFNRGEFSSGHLQNKPNMDLVFPQKPNNMGITLGKIKKYNPNKGLITLELEDNVEIGDGIAFENEDTKYTVSELMENNINIKLGTPKMKVVLGRMKGNIKVGDRVYKITDKNLWAKSIESFSKENIKNKINCALEIKANCKIKIFVQALNYSQNFEYDFIPYEAKNLPITKEKIINQFNKTKDTCFEFSKLNLNIDNNLFIPIHILNEIRRVIVKKVEEKIVNSFKRKSNASLDTPDLPDACSPKEKATLLNTLNLNYDYSKLKNIEKIYIPLKYFENKEYENILRTLENKAKIYIYMPVVIKDRYLNTIKERVNRAIEKYNISGGVIADLSSIDLFKGKDLIANYNFNVFNSYSVLEVKKLGINSVTISPELNQNEKLPTKDAEVIVYGKIPLMTMSYCMLGKSNRCYSNCKHYCLENKTYYLNDRYNFKFRVIPDNIQTLTTIYNSRNIFLEKTNVKCERFDFIDETIEEINALLEKWD